MGVVGKSAFNILFGGSRFNWGSAFSDLEKGSVDTCNEGRFCNLSVLFLREKKVS